MTSTSHLSTTLPAALQVHLELPLYGDEHRLLAQSLWSWAQALPPVDHDDTDRACRHLMRQLGDAGFLRYCVPQAYGGALPELDSRALCLIREVLVASLHNHPPSLCIEVGRQNTPSPLRPGFSDLEVALRALKAEAA